MNPSSAKNLQGFVKFLNVRGLSPHTISNYTRYADDWLDWLGNREASMMAAETYLLSRAGAGDSPATLSLRISAMKSFYERLVSIGSAPNNPFGFIKKPRLPKKLPTILNNETMIELMSAPFVNKNENQTLATRDATIIAVLYSTGARVSELIHMKWNDLNDDFASVKVFGKGRKERHCLIAPPAMKLLRKWQLLQSHKTGYIFTNLSGTRLRRESVCRIVKVLGKKIGITVSPHMIRHAMATAMITGECDLLSLSDMLGHASVQTTQMYVHLSMNFISAAHANSHPLYRV